METVNVRKEDQILMSLVHYFVTKENYSPIFVHGVKDEIWLEKLDGPYRVIRINTHRIFNEEQFKYDQYRIKNIIKQIKRKTMSFNISMLNISLNADENVDLINVGSVDNIKVTEIKDIEENGLMTEMFPNIKGNLLKDTNGVELIFNVTKDINEKTERENKKFEKIFSPKKIVVTYIIMALCLIGYGLLLLFGGDNYAFYVLGANNKSWLLNGSVYRLITYAFLHGGLIHLACNLYSLNIIGGQAESKYGKLRFAIIYLLSAIGGGLLSAAFTDGISIGASGAIFGLLGAMLYFGTRFRLYLKDSLQNTLLPVILINLFIGFTLPGIDNACHIGGLITGYLISMSLGIPEDEKKSDRINGTILLLMFLAFLIYLVFFRVA